MKPYKIISTLTLAIILVACANLPNTYFDQVEKNKPHAVIQFEMGEKRGLFFDVRVANIIPSSINGMPVNSWRQGWKLHAFEEFLIPPGDTMVFLYYKGDDASGDGYVRFNAIKDEIYKITHVVNEDKNRIGFNVINSKGKTIELRWFPGGWIKGGDYVYTYNVPEKITVLIEASFDGNLEKVEKLLHDGADPNISDGKFNALDVAVFNGYIDVVKKLIEYDANIIGPYMSIAAGQGYYSLVKLLIESGAYVDSPGIDGNNALMAAADKGHINIVSLLLSKGAYIHTRNKNGKTAQDLANDSGFQKIVDMIKKSTETKKEKLYM